MADQSERMDMSAVQMTHARSLSLASFTVPVWEREHAEGRQGVPTQETRE